MASILTNTGAMVALQTMRGINKEMGTVQNQISTGMKVGTAKDNAATWAIASVMRSDVAGLKSVSESLDVGRATVSVARVATESISELMEEVKAKVLAAGDLTNEDSRTKLKTDIDNIADQIDTMLRSASFNGVNLIAEVDEDGDFVVKPAADASLDVVSSLKRDAAGALTTETIAVDTQNLGFSELEYVDAAGVDQTLTEASIGAHLKTLFATPANTIDLNEALSKIEGLTASVIDAAADFGSKEKQIEIQANFVSKLTDALNQGIGALVDADMEEASAKLQALQVQQQLGIQAMSIANQQPQNILSLFR